MAFSVQTFEAPYPAVMMRGRVTITTADDAATVEEARAITRRYIAPEEVDDYMQEWSEPRTSVTN